MKSIENYDQKIAVEYLKTKIIQLSWNLNVELTPQQADYMSNEMFRLIKDQVNKKRLFDMTEERINEIFDNMFIGKTSINRISVINIFRSFNELCIFKEINIAR
jgi:hypothetical protein